MGVIGTIYLLHIEPPYRHAKHYLGWTLDAEGRFAEHMAGRGSPLVRAAVQAGCTVTKVAEWPGDRNEERRIKNMGGHAKSRRCPLCRVAHLAAEAAQRRPKTNPIPQEV